MLQSYFILAQALTQNVVEIFDFLPQKRQNIGATRYSHIMLEIVRNKARRFMVKRYSSNPVPIEMQLYGEQFAYGHREILLKYCDTSETYMFKAHVPHGGVSPASIDPINRLNDENGIPILQLRWRHDSALEAEEANIKNVTPIGAPFLYALSNTGCKKDQISDQIQQSVGKFDWPRESVDQNEYLSDSKNILYMPLHTWDGDVHIHQIPKDSPLHKLQKNNITVLLGFLDFCDPIIRHSYSELGWNVECAGVRSSKITGSPAGSRNNFLYNLQKIISQNDIVVSNEFTTGLYYAASMGKKIGILNQTLNYELKYSSWQDQSQFEKRMIIIRNYYDWLIGGNHGASFTNNVETALGIKSMRTSEFLKENIELVEFKSYGKNLVS